MIGKVLLGLETSDTLAEFYGEQAVFRKEIETPQDIIRRIERVTAKEIQRIAQEIFRDAALNCTVVGPFREFPKDISLSVLR